MTNFLELISRLLGTEEDRFIIGGKKNGFAIENTENECEFNDASLGITKKTSRFKSVKLYGAISGKYVELRTADDLGEDQIIYFPGAEIPSSLHAMSHVTGVDIIPNAVAAGNSGLMSGSDKAKLDGIEVGAEVNVNADWNSSSGDSQILNKPSTMPPSAHNVTSHSDWPADLDTTELGYVNGVTSAIQEQLNGKSDTGHNHSGVYESANANIQGHISAASPHSGHVVSNVGIIGATKTKITYDAKGLVTSGADATTADIADSEDKRYCTDAEKTKLTGIEAGAEVNVNADWNAPSGDAQILNKPTTMPPSSHNVVSHADWPADLDVTELGYVNGVTSAIQTQIDGKSAKISPSVVGNFVSFSDITGGQADSGSKATDFAVAARGVTNGDSHDHSGGDGAQIAYGELSGLPTLPANEAGAANNFLSAYNSTTGAFSKARPTWANVDKATSDIADITTKSHTSLSDKGTLTHANIDTLTASHADVQLQYTDANTITLAGLLTKYVMVNGEMVDISSSKTIDTNSASHFIISGTTSVSKSTALNSYSGNGSDGNAYNAYGLHHVYVCNSNACWNFASYDRRGSIILSASAPTNGYLAASGDGLNARHVGWVACNSSRQLDSVLTVASTYNVAIRRNTISGVSGNVALTPNTGWQDLPGGDCQMYVVMPPNSVARFLAQFTVENNDVDLDGIVIQINTPNNSVSFGEYLGLVTGYRYQCTETFEFSDTYINAAVKLIKLRVNPGLNANSSPLIYCNATMLQIEVKQS